jgi:hypothetical protein
MDRARAIGRDLGVLREFVSLHCRQEHGGAALCPECRGVLAYAIRRRRACPMDPKPACRKCPTHCYREPYRAKIRAIMKAGAVYYVTHGRVIKLMKLAMGSRPAPKVEAS